MPSMEDKYNLHRKDAHKLLDLALRLASVGNYDEALCLLDEVAKLAPGLKADAYRNKAVIFGQLKDYRQSLEWCERALQLEPDYAEVWYQAGMCYFRFAQFQKALDCYERAKQLGLRRAGLEHDIRACRLNLRLTLVSDDAWRTHFDNAVKLFNFGRMGEAQSECETARHLAHKAGNLSGEALSLVELGRCKIAQGNLEDALRDLQESYEKAEICGSAEAMANALDALGIYYRDIGQLSLAIDHFNRALEICQHASPPSLEGVCCVSANLARTYLYRNCIGGEDLARAEKILTSAVEVAKNLPVRSVHDLQGKVRVWQILTLLFIQRRALEKAVDCLEYCRLLKLGRLNRRPPVIEQLGNMRRTVLDLLPLIDYLQQELEAALDSQDIHSTISCHFFKAMAHIELASRILQERPRPGLCLFRSQRMRKDHTWHRRQAHRLYSEGISMLERELRARLRGAESRSTFLEHRIDAYEQMVILCLVLDRRGEAIEYVERSRSRVFLDQLATTTIWTPTTVNQELITAEAELLDRVSTLAAARQRAEGERFSFFDDQLRDAERQLNKVWNDMEKDAAEYVALRRAAPAAFEEVRSCLHNA
jgi:tetratricopeptide (TPR) repeat protein